MMNRPRAAPERMRVDDSCSNVGLRQQDSLRQPSPLGQVAGDRGGIRAPGTVGSVGTLAVGLENFLFHAAARFEAQQIDGFFQMSARDYHRRRTHLM